MNCPNCGTQLTLYIIGRPGAWPNDHEYVCKMCKSIGWIGLGGEFRTYADPVGTSGPLIIREMYRRKLDERT